MQLRGQKLQKFLEQCLLEEINSKVSENDRFRYSQKAFAARAGVSRQTIRAHQEFIDDLLSAHNLKRRVLDKNAKVSSLERLVDKMSMELEITTRRYESMRAQYLIMFELLVEESFDVSKFASVADKRKHLLSNAAKCPVCGG
ncbi:hypothetical protein [Pseudomonas asiatica]|uniref:hypothetical protein n=1 Tax=Pseudomonas asiatica TaxID=2219225 RepID=UPI0018AB38ED|nr:hypothetical protein [Pseudomonas asiatica]MBF8805751.1 hypothetical protein [Pseudomonas asiatica]